MEHVLIRTNASKNTGLGHLVRCVSLARKLRSKDVRVTIVLDAIESSTSGFLGNIDTLTLYESQPETLDEKTDADLFRNIIAENTVSWVILDDYRLGKTWETIIQSEGTKLCVIDDVLRQHQCDLLVDMRWRGPQTSHSYDQLVHADTVKLLGPKYALLSDEYNSPELVDNNSDIFHIMVGDTGNIERSKSVIDTLVKHQGNFNKKISITLVLGPFAIADQKDHDYFQNFDCVELLVGKNNLYPYLKKTHLYIGASGGIIYQLLALKIPALTFSLTENQTNDISHLEDIGHYFHINQWPTNFDKELIQFIQSVISQYPVFKTLVSQAKIAIDGNGANEIANTLLSQLSDDSSTNERSNYTQVRQQENTYNNEISLSESHNIREVVTQDINHYLSSRNLNKNRPNMIQSTRISVLHHYAWWFTNRRDSYLLSRLGEPCLYIWHEQKQYNNKHYLIGGWFVCNDETDFQDALLALSWQLNRCKTTHPGIPWIAVIHRNNKFVKLLNDYLGFREIPSGEEKFTETRDAINTIFEHADNNNYYYVTYP